MFNFCTQKPFIATVILCLLLLLTASIFVNTVDYWHFFIIGSVLSSCFQQSWQQLFFAVCTLCLCYLILLLTNNFAISASLALLGLFCSVLLSRQKERLILPFGIIMTAFLLHLFYVQQTNISLWQHDLGGIRYYMSKITESGINWRHFDSWSMYYLFHQPLHFILNGHLFTLMQLVISKRFALENLQYVSLFYVTVTTLLYAAILKRLQFSTIINNALLCLMAFSPSLILFSGYISDDTPVLCWSMAVNYFLICWYQEERLSHILAAAFCFAAGCLTKLSILLLVPAICFLFLHKLACSTNRQRIWLHLCSFVIIAVPLSLLWVIRNHILFDMQFFNVPDTSPAGQNFYHLSLLARLSDFSMALSPFIDAPQIVDSNIFFALIKTELFGEWDFSKTVPFILKPAYALYFLNVIIHILILCAVLRCLFLMLSSKQPTTPFCLFFILQYVTIWLYAGKYALDYPYVCSTDYRLFAQLMLSGTLLGFALCSLRQQKMASRCLLTISICYALLVTFIYGALIFYS